MRKFAKSALGQVRLGCIAVSTDEGSLAEALKACNPNQNYKGAQSRRKVVSYSQIYLVKKKKPEGNSKARKGKIKAKDDL